MRLEYWRAFVKTKLLNDEGGQRTFAVVFDKGDDVPRGLIEFAKKNRLTAAQFTAIGAFSRVTLGYFERARKEYKHIPIEEQVEVVSLIGNIASGEDGPKLHAHVVVGKSDGSAHGGHLLEARVWPTLEVVLIESPRHLQRRSDEESGLALLDLAA
jgi:hypothetical protein